MGQCLETTDLDLQIQEPVPPAGPGNKLGSSETGTILLQNDQVDVLLVSKLATYPAQMEISSYYSSTTL